MHIYLHTNLNVACLGAGAANTDTPSKWNQAQQQPGQSLGDTLRPVQVQVDKLWVRKATKVADIPDWLLPLLLVVALLHFFFFVVAR